MSNPDITTLGPPPSRTPIPITDNALRITDGTPLAKWLNLLYEILKNVGPVNPILIELSNEALTALYNNNPIIDFGPRLANLEAGLLAMPIVADLSAKIANLEAQLAAIQQNPAYTDGNLQLLANIEPLPLPQGLNISDSPTFDSLTLSSLIISLLTSGSVLFAGAGGAVSQDNAKFFWDEANQRLGILNATPAKTLDIGAASNFTVDSLGNVVANSVASATYSQAGTVTFQNITSGDLDFISPGDIFLNPTGNVKFGSFSASAAPPVVGYITILDAGGTPRRLAVV